MDILLTLFNVNGEKYDLMLKMLVEFIAIKLA